MGAEHTVEFIIRVGFRMIGVLLTFYAGIMAISGGLMAFVAGVGLTKQFLLAVVPSIAFLLGGIGLVLLAKPLSRWIAWTK